MNWPQSVQKVLEIYCKIPTYSCTRLEKQINWEDVFWAWLECCSCYKSYFAQWWPEQARSGADRHEYLFLSLTSMYQEDQINFIEQF
jgi:hypothetical protein